MLVGRFSIGRIAAPEPRLVISGRLSEGLPERERRRGRRLERAAIGDNRRWHGAGNNAELGDPGGSGWPLDQDDVPPKVGERAA